MSDPSIFLKTIQTWFFDARWFRIVSEPISTVDNWDWIQDALTNYNNVVIGKDKSQIFVIKKPLILKSYQSVIINCTIKVANTETSLITANVLPLATQVHVTDASKFKVGQWINITDDDQPLVGGGAGHTRRMGYVSRITNVNLITNIIDFVAPLYTSAGTGLLVASNAIAGIYNSAFLAESKTNISISGTGTIDCNKINGFDKGAWNTGGQEETRSGNGICFHDCNYIDLKDFNLHDAILHNITLWMTDNVQCNAIKLKACTDKNILVYSCDDVVFNGCITNDAEFEDGICLYYGNNRIRINNCTAKNNGRSNFSLNSTNTDIQFNNCYASDCGNGLYCGLSSNMVINNMIIKNCGYIRHRLTSVNSPLEISSCHDITINNLIVDGYTDYDEAQYQTSIYGLCYDIAFNNCIFKNTDHIVSVGANGYGVCIYTSGGFSPERISFTGCVFHDLLIAVGTINDAVDRMVFRDCIFHDNTAIGTLRASQKFYNCRGIYLQESGTITMGAAAVLVYGSSHVADVKALDMHNFKFYFKSNNGGLSTKIWCDWTSLFAFPANNFRVNVDVAPGVNTDIVWEYDDNIRQ